MKVTEIKNGKYTKHQIVVTKELSLPLKIEKGDELEVVNLDVDKKEFTLRLVKKKRDGKKK